MGEIFISHTSDMSSFPADRSFVDAAIRAVVAARLVPVDMQHFGARDGLPALYCQQRVRESDAFVGLIGLRYGSIVPGTGVSYTELEFDEATAQGKQRLIFFLDEDAPLPRRLVDGDPTRIDAFRERLRNAGVMVKTFASAVGLEKDLFQALVGLPLAGGDAGAPSPGGGRDAEFAAARAEYLSRVVQHYRRLDLAVLTPAEHEEDAPALLESVFVPQHVRADPPPAEFPKELLRRILATGETGDPGRAQGLPDGLPEGLPEGVDAERLARVRAAYGQRPALPVLDVVAAPGNRLLVLLGDPGSGKSALARYLAISLAGGSAPPPPAGLAGSLPLLVELRIFADLRRDFPTFLDFLGHLHGTDGLGLPRRLLERHLRAGGPALVIFDGLDELFDPKERELLARQIAGFAAHFPQIRVVVTSRVIGYRRALFDQAGFAHYTIQDLDADQVERFVRGWYGRGRPDRPDEAGRLRERLNRALRESPSIRELAGNPMLLTVLAITGRRQELPRERRAVYAHAAAVLVEQWDVNRHLRDSSVRADYLDSEDKRELLRRVAARMQRRCSGFEGNHIRGAELLEEFEGYLRSRYQLERPAAKVVAKAMLAQFRERSFILGCYGADVYGFVHRAFLEYFCAEEIVFRFHQRRELTPAELTTDVFGRHWADEGWQEVLLLIAGMIDGRFTAAIVDHLLERVNPLAALTPDVPPPNVVLALRCLAEVRNAGAVARQGAAVLDAVISLLEYSHGRYAHEVNDMLERHVIRVLAAAGTRWPGRSRYRDWFTVRGAFLAWSPTSSLIARIAAALFADCAEIHDAMRARTLFATDWTVRKAAVEALAAGWRDDPTTLALLHDRALRDGEWVVRHAAVTAIAAGWRHDPGTFALLRRCAVHDTDEAVRQAAVEAMAAGWPGDAQPRSVLRACALDDSEWAVRRAAVRALATGWRDDPDTVSLLRDRALRDDASAVRGAAVRALSAAWRGGRDGRDLPALLRDCASCDDAAVRRTAVQVIAAEWDHDDRTPALLRDRAVHDDNAAVRQAALSAVAAGAAGRGDPAAGRLLRDRAADDPDAAVRRAAVQAVGGDWREDPETVRFLHNRARRDGDGAVRRAALQAIVATAAELADDPDAARLLDDRLERDRDAFVREAALRAIAASRRGDPATARLLRRHAVHDEHWAVRRAAVQALAAGWGDEAGTLVQLRERATHDGDKDVRREAGRAVAARWRDSTTLPWLRDDAARDPEPAVRRMALRAIAAGWRDEAGTLPLLAACATGDDAWAVRRTALQVIAAGWRDHPDTVPLLHDRAGGDGSQAVRHAAAVLLAVGWRDDPRTPALLRQAALRDGGEGVRRAAVQALAVGWRERPDTSPLLRELACRDPAPAVRAAAVQATTVGWHGDPATFALLRTRVRRDGEAALRLVAVGAVAAGWREHPQALRLLRELARRDGDGSVRRAAVEAIAAGWRGDPDTFRLLYDRAVRDGYGAVRQVAVEAIAAGWRGEPAAFRLLCDRAVRDGYAAVRRAAVEAIAAGWRDGPDARRLLRERAARDDDESVRQVARQALAARPAHIDID
jgi:HEAT repeat protein